MKAAVTTHIHYYSAFLNGYIYYFNNCFAGLTYPAHVSQNIDKQTAKDEIGTKCLMIQNRQK